MACGGAAAAATDSAGGALTGLVARDFGLGHEDHPNLLRVNEQIWFHFEVQNTSGGEKPYGGLGVLAGDHLKSASDLGIPLTGGKGRAIEVASGVAIGIGGFLKLLSDRSQSDEVVERRSNPRAL